MEEKKLSEKLRDNGIFVITSEINEETTHSLIFALLDFSASNPEKEIKLYISSGSVDYLNVFAIYDVIKSLLEKQWWNGTDDDIKEVERCFWNVSAFLKGTK